MGVPRPGGSQGQFVYTPSAGTQGYDRVTARAVRHLALLYAWKEEQVYVVFTPDIEGIFKLKKKKKKHAEVSLLYGKDCTIK